MKTRIIVLSLLLSIALGVSARTFFANDEIRVYTDQTYHDSQIHWDWDYSALWLYLFSTENSNNKWIQLEYKESDYFSAIIPEGSNYNRLVLVRKPTGKGEGWSDITNQTCNIRIPDDPSCNVLYKFWKKEGDCTDDAYSEWKTYTPDISQIKSTISGVTQEEISVCPSAAGTLFALHPKIRSDKKDYDYEKVSRHTWLRSTDGKSSWTSLDNFAGKVRDEEKEKDLDTNLPSTIPSGGVYYYLYSLNPSGRRLIHVKVNNVGCDLDCEITAFETANSAVNADNNTFTLDGMVAFGEANGKSLKIECSGKDTIITAPKSPQSFSLHGVPAATVDGQKATAKASFIGGGAACSMEKEVDIPNATIAADTTTLNQMTGTTYVFIPADTIASNQFVWLRKDENTGTVETIVSAWKKLEVDAISHDSTVTYIYKEYNPAPGSMENLMTNGSYEDSWPYATKKVSEYDYWGTFPETDTPPSIDFYTNESVNPGLAKKDNGFAVVRNAKNFAHTYAAVEARDGLNFALFDAKSGSEGANKKAWLATTAMHPKLKLKAGTTYVLSFWAANINNYGEMDNAAEFEFRIEAPGQSTPIAKSKKLNLSDAKFHNNIWHQLSETFTADKDYDNITISVVNLNKKELKVGNDFALDDIQFHPISSVSRNVKSQQIFVAKAHEPKIDAFTATVVQLDCNAEEKYTIQMHVVFQNPKGQLIIKDKTTGTEYPYDVTATFDTPTNLDKDIVINGLTPVNHQWEAYFSEWTSAKRTAETIAPVVPTIEARNFRFSNPTPDCALKTTLTFDLDYTYQQGNLTYWVDGLAARTATFTPQDRAKLTLTDLTFADIPADGKDNHVLHVSFDGPNSCKDIDFNLPAVPYSPVIDAVTLTGVPTLVPCDATAYDITVAFTPYFTPIPAGKQIILTYDSVGDTKTTAPIALADFPYTLTIHNIANDKHSVFAAFADAPDCKAEAKYDAPERETCDRDTFTICEGGSYWWHEEYRTGPVGENKFGDGKDSLFLFVKEKPTISIGTIAMTCDEANVVRIPFSVAKGNPDNFDIDIVGSHFPGTLDIVGTDTAFVFTPATMEAGDYAAHVTVGETDVPCTSTVDINFTIAISGQMYSKWTDVLFIGNKEGRYTGYQWFADGAAMSGENLQYLYDPKGLSGTTILYHCRLTTTDGKTLYTCPQTFDEVTPSRTVTTTPAQVKSTTMYDTMGRVIKGTPHNGIYIISEELENGEIRTRKITIYE